MRVNRISFGLERRIDELLVIIIELRLRLRLGTTARTRWLRRILVTQFDGKATLTRRKTRRATRNLDGLKEV